MAEQVGRYTLDRKLASGGMGEVFLAKEDGPQGKVCVIKRMLPNLMSDTQFVTMFLDEAKLVAQLNHPNIAPLYDFGMAKGVLYLSMEYVPGANLRVIVKDHAARNLKLPFNEVARIMSQAALALDYAHRATSLDGKPLRLIHRDVSPQNILLGTNGVVKLIDFGVAKASTASQQTAAGLIKGKYAYMSPEQLRGQPLDGRSDIFGLGLVLYELLAGERAVPGKTDAEVAQNALTMRFPPIEQRRPDVPDKLKGILYKALQKDREQRYQTAAEFSSDLERFLADRRSSPTGAELSALIPRAAPSPIPVQTVSPGPTVPWASSGNAAAAAPTASAKAWSPTQQPGAFWDNQPVSPTEMSTEDGMPPTVQLTPSQLPMASQLTPPSLPKPVNDSEARTEFIENLKLPPPPPAMARPPPPAPSEAATKHVVMKELPPPPMAAPLSMPRAPYSDQSSLSSVASRRPPLPWVLSGVVLLLGLALVAWGFVANRKPKLAPPVPVQIAKQTPPVEPATPPVPTPTPTPPVVEVTSPQVPVAPAPPEAVESAYVNVVSSVPARVLVDNNAVGKTPLEVSVAPGRHTLTFEDQITGLKQNRALQIAAGERRKESWNPERGTLLIRAAPWAEVFVGEKSLGVTPMEPLELIAGRHQFRFTNSDTKRTVQRVVDINPGKETLVKVDLR